MVPGPGVDSGSGDGSGGRHATEHGRGNRCQALSNQLAIGVARRAVGQRVGHFGRQEALDGSQDGQVDSG
jgi:hypothetical protein